MLSLELSFGAAVIAGLLGSTHCLGMCGGIVGALNLGIDPASRRGSQIVYQLCYNLGRICSYFAIGFIAGTLGASLAGFGIGAGTGQLVAAVFMIALGLYLANWWRGLALFERLGARLWRRIEPLGRGLFPLRHPGQALLLGMLWGWLPCGLVYAMLAWALTTASPLQAALIMLGFGLGTLPALLIAGRVFSRFQTWVRSPLVRGFAGAGVILFGLYSAFGAFDHQHHRHHAGRHPAVSDQAALWPTPALPASLHRVA